jgi:hypothetical protein
VDEIKLVPAEPHGVILWYDTIEAFLDQLRNCDFYKEDPI